MLVDKAFSPLSRVGLLGFKSLCNASTFSVPKDIMCCMYIRFVACSLVEYQGFFKSGVQMFQITKSRNALFRQRSISQMMHHAYHTNSYISEHLYFGYHIHHFSCGCLSVPFLSAPATQLLRSSSFLQRNETGSCYTLSLRNFKVNE